MEQVQTIEGFEIPEGKTAFKLEGLQNPIQEASELFENITEINVFQANDVWYAIVDNSATVA